MKKITAVLNSPTKIALFAVCCVLLICVVAFATIHAGAGVNANKTLGMDKCVNVALHDAGFRSEDVSNLSAHYETEDGTPIYEVTFSAGGFAYEYQIKAADGTILEADKDALRETSTNGSQLVEGNQTGSAGDAANASLISKAKAKEIALAHAGVTASKASFVEVKLDNEDGTQVYEVEFYSGSTESLGVNGNYAKEMLHGLQLLDDSGLNYQISSVLTNYNCQVNVLAELLHELSHLKHIRDWRIIPASNSIYKEYNVFSHLKPTKAQITKVFNQIRPLLTQVSFPVILGKEVTDKNYQDTWGGSRCFKGSECSALTTHMFILPDGKVTVCEQLYWHPQFIIGNVTTQSLKEVWHSPQALHLCSLSRQDINKESPCRECRLFEDCFSYQNRCWSDIIKAYGKDCWDFPDPRCCFAPAMKNKLSYD